MSDKIPKHNEMFAPQDVYSHWESDVDDYLATLPKEATLSVIDSLGEMIDERECEWRLMEQPNKFRTGCGRPNAIMQGSFKHCPYCGGRIKEAMK